MSGKVPFPDLPDRLTEEAFWALVGRGESSTTEFRERLAQKAGRLQDALVAFANVNGGAIVLGVAHPPPHRIVGCDWSQAVQERLEEVARETHPPLRLDVRPTRAGGQTVVFCQVEPVEQGWVQTSDGRLLVRAGPTNRTLVGRELERFIRERGLDPVEDTPISGVRPADLRVDLVRAYLEARLPRHRSASNEALRDLGYIEADGTVRLSGLLLFGKRPQDASRRYGIEIQRFEGSASGGATLRQRDELTGPLTELVQTADDAIYRSMRRDAVVRGLIREEVPEYPPVVLREGLVNAVAHRDYAASGSSVVVRMYDDAIEIESPGALPGYVTVDNLREAQYSRNPSIMDALTTLGFVEEAGQGIDRMYMEMEAALLDPPQFEERRGTFVVRLRGSGVFTAEDRLWVSGLETPGLSGHAKAALVYVRRNGSMRNEELRELRSLDREQARTTLQGLVAKGLLRKTGRGRGTRYALGATAARDAPTPSLDDRFQVILAHAQRRGKIVNTDVRGLLGVDRHTAFGLLTELVRRGLLVPEGERRGRRYVPTNK